VGGVISSILFSTGKKLFAVYLTHAGTANAFGAAGSLAVLLMWLYFAGAVLLLGAEASASRREVHDAKRASVRKAPDMDRTSMYAPAPAPAPASGLSDSGDKTKAQTANVLPNKHAANTMQPTTEQFPQDSTTRGFPTIWSVVKANPWRLAVAAAGAAIFVVTRGSGHSRKLSESSAKDW
jgi:membrane protein